MKKRNLLAFVGALCLVLFVILTSLVSCGNKDIFDFEYTFTEAYIYFPDGDVEHVKLAGWTDYEDSDMVQIRTADGKVYLTHSSNIVLVGDD